MEDIIEELIQEEIEDEADAHEENKNRNVLREKLVVFYTDSRAEKMLTETEYRSVLHFL
jgi:CBS domain containing-hemolysin-like protein